jgi:hypothetical protein
VKGAAISESTMAHWIRNVAVRDYELIPKTPVPAWVLSGPPDFSACVQHLAGGAGHKAALLAKCRGGYEDLRRQAAQFLISCRWLIAAGKALGLAAPQSKIEARLTRVIKSDFVDRAHFDRYLQLSGETLKDNFFRMEVKVYSEGIEHLFATKPGLNTKQRQTALAEWEVSSPKRWSAMTVCTTAYINPNCRNYKGPEQPEIRL